MVNELNAPPFYRQFVYWALCIAIFTYLNYSFLQDLARVPFAIVLELSLAIVVFNVIRWADAYEPEPILAMLWTMLAGASISVLIVSWAYQLEGSRNLDVFYVGLVEELSKAVILIPIFSARLIHSWIDGYVYGALIGLGFSISEDFLYAAYESDPAGIILARGLESIFAHSLFSGLIGAAIAFTVSQKHQIGLLFGLFGILAHVSWNTLVITIIESAPLLAGLLTPLIFFILANQLRIEEIKSIISRAEKLRESENIDNHQFHLITNLSYRKAFRSKLSTAFERKKFDQSIIDLLDNEL